MHAMESTDGYGISLPELFRLLMNHRRKMMLIMGAGLLATLVVVFVAPRTYRSEARLLVRVGRSTIGLDPTASLGQINPIHKPLDSEILSVQATMYSRTLMEKTVDTLTPEFVLAKGEPSEGAAMEEPGFSLNLGGRLRDLLVGVGLADPMNARDGAIRTLENSFAVYIEPGSSVLICEVKSNHHLRAQRILEVMMEHAMQMHLAVNHTAGEYQFFVEQLSVLDDQWKEKADALRQFKNERNLTSVEGKRRIVEEQIRTVETDILTSTSNLQASIAMIESLTEQFADVPARYSSSEVSGVSNQASDLLMQTYYNLLITEADLSSRYSGDNPKLTQVRRQLKAAEKAVADEPDSRSQVTDSVNPTRVSLELQMVSERGKIASLRARIESLNSQLVELYRGVAQLNQDEQQLIDLQQQVETLAAKARKYNENIEQARIIDAMESSHISNISLFQPATAVPRAESPKLIVIVALGFALSIGAAFSFVLAQEFILRSFAIDARVSRTDAIAVRREHDWNNLEDREIEAVTSSRLANAAVANDSHRVTRVDDHIYIDSGLDGRAENPQRRVAAVSGVRIRTSR